MSIVNTNIPYNSSVLRQNIRDLVRLYPFLNIQTVGNSILGEDIWVIKLGKGSKQVFYSAAIHANEWITSPLLMKFVEDYANAYVNNESLFGYNIRNLYETVSIFIMPMVNPDGVNLVTNSLPSNSVAFNRALNISNDYPEFPFPSRMEG